tara:strand:- start:628 stop:876 length:249 start_codon:yes stop_codon:yes gene_type:complete
MGTMHALTIVKTGLKKLLTGTLILGTQLNSPITDYLLIISIPTEAGYATPATGGHYSIFDLGTSRLEQILALDSVIFRQIAI